MSKLRNNLIKENPLIPYYEEFYECKIKSNYDLQNVIRVSDCLAFSDWYFKKKLAEMKEVIKLF